MVEFLPKMKTDIMLKKGSKTLIIDTKYYGHMMQEQFNKLSINSSNLYQIFTYVKNQDSEGTGNVSGMLLYTFYSMDGIWEAFYTIDMQLDRCFLSTSLTL